MATLNIKNLCKSVLITFLLVFTSSVSANIGKIVYGYGNNFALDGDGNRRNIKKGSEIKEGDTLVTGRGRLHVRLIDGGFISVYPNSEYKINTFKYSGKKIGNSSLATNNKSTKKAAESKKDKGLFSLLKGAARQVTGLLGRTYKENFKFKTTVATIGIRGTGFFARLCQADCFDAEGKPMQDGMYVKNNTGIITMTTNAGDIALAQGQSAFAASNEDAPQQIIQPPVAYSAITPDMELFDFDEKDAGFDFEIETDTGTGTGTGAPVDPTVPPPSVVITKMEYVASQGTSFPAPFGGINTASALNSVQQEGEEIRHFEGIGLTDGGTLIFDSAAATLVESGSDTTLGVLWNRWSSGYTFAEGGTDITVLGTESGNDIHLIGSDNITPDLAGLTGKGSVNYVSSGGTSPTITGFSAANQTGTQTLSATINYAVAEVTNFQLDVNFGATSMNVNASTVEFLTGTSGNMISLSGTCSGPECGLNGGGVNGQTSINLVGPNAEGIYGVYNLTNQENAVSGSYVATDASIPQL